MNYCTQCGAGLKPLFTTLVCPNECDLPPERRSRPALAPAVGDAELDAMLAAVDKWDDVTPVHPAHCTHVSSYVWGGHTWCWHCGACVSSP